MSQNNVSRRAFIRSASAGAAAVTVGVVGAYGSSADKANTLAVLGGTPVRKGPFPVWPQTTAEIEKSLVAAFRSGKWGRTLGASRHGSGQVGQFEKRFAEMVGAKHCLATGSGTQSLHTALHAVGVEAGDEVLVAPCTYLASIQAVLMCNALPMRWRKSMKTGSSLPECDRETLYELNPGFPAITMVVSRTQASQRARQRRAVSRFSRATEAVSCQPWSGASPQPNLRKHARTMRTSPAQRR